MQEEQEQESAVQEDQQPAPNPPVLRDENGWKVETQSQQGLRRGKDQTGFGCVPASASMILSFWHTKDPSHSTKSVQDLLDVNFGQGVFGIKGMSPTQLHDEMQDLGYECQDFVGSDLETLKEHVAKGPVMAIVKLDMKTKGDVHAVVVRDITEDNQVCLNDPWTGQMHTYSWEEFSRSWGSEFYNSETKSVGPSNNFMVIRPRST